MGQLEKVKVEDLPMLWIFLMVLWTLSFYESSKTSCVLDPTVLGSKYNYLQVLVESSRTGISSYFVQIQSHGS
jgi:hypothetical protein